MTALENKLECFANGRNRSVATNQIYFLMVSTSPNTNDCQWFGCAIKDSWILPV